MSSSHRISFAIGVIAMVTSVTVMGVVGVWSALSRAPLPIVPSPAATPPKPPGPAAGDLPAPSVPQPLGGVGLRPGDTASASLFWPGHRTAAVMCAVSALLMMSACDAAAPSDPEPYLHRVVAVWGIDVPSSTEVQEYYSSEADFHGGRDDVYVLDIPTADRNGAWDPAAYEHGVPSDGAPAVSEISASAGAPVTDDLLDSLRCGDPVRADQNFILLCFDEKADAFYVFEQLF